MMRILFFAAFIIAGLLSPLCHAYPGGSGSAADPYQIATKADLLALAETTSDYDKCFILTADIDLQGETFTNSIIARNTVENSVTYIGTAFTGIFDGDGHTIKNFTIDTQSYHYIGLFGQIDPGGCLKNMGILNCSFWGGCYVGALAGANNGGVIMQCYSAGTVRGANGIGGLVGQNTGAITRCYSSGDTNGSYQVGGLVGYNIGGVGNCYSTSNVSGMPTGTLTQITGDEYKYGAGGLIGYNKGGFIEKSYSTGSVTGGYVGGLVGSSGYYEDSIEWLCDWICDDQGFCWENCIALPTSTFIYSEDWVQDSFWDMDSSGCSSSAGGSPTWGNIDQFLNAEWDFAVETLNGTEDIWVMFQGQYPQFTWQCPIAGDISMPYGVEISDLMKFAEHWLQTDCPNECEGADLTGDGAVDLDDFSILAGHWQQTTLLGTTVAVPDLSGLTYEDAAALLIAAGLQMGYMETSYDETVPNEHIISQNPTAGSIVYPNMAVNIVVSEGSNFVYIPNVVGMNQSDALMMLQTLQLTAAVTYSYSDTVAKDYVISQNPAAETVVQQDSSINIVVSLGRAYSGGAGTPEDPYQISTSENLKSIGDNGSSCFILMNDIDMNGVMWTRSYGMGSFSGTFDGNGHKICNLTYTYSGYSAYIGLFGSIDHATVKNLTLENLIISLNGPNVQYLGSLAGYMTAGTISNCHVTGTISGSGSNNDCIGGLIGYMAGGTVSHCSFTGIVSETGTGSELIGGLVGQIYNDGTIEYCTSTAQVRGEKYIGGIAGYLRYYCNIQSCSSSGSIISSGEDCGGLAGYLYDNCTIHHCTSTCSVSGTKTLGGLVGFQSYSSTYNCSSTGNVTGTDSLGGLVGYLYYGHISDSWSTGDVSGRDYLGGLLGDQGPVSTIYNCSGMGNISGMKYLGGLVGRQNSQGTIKNSCSTGQVTGKDYLGGLIGRQSDCGISNCYSRSNISGSEECVYLGGLIGYQNYCSVSNCYSTGAVTGGSAGSYIGGLIGYGIGITTNSYWDVITSGQASSSGGKGRYTEQMKHAENYIGWNSQEPVWILDEGNDYPHLTWEGTVGTILPSQVLGEYIPGNGIQGDPYRLTTAGQLNRVGLFPASWDKRFSLDADIDLSEITGVEFNIIGASYDGFKGVFDGNDHIIKSLTYQTEGYECYIGLFGRIHLATVQNLGLENIYISTKGIYAGGLAGTQYSSCTVNNCFSTGCINGTDYIGGLAGSASDGTIHNCYSTCSVSGNDIIGGLAGYITWIDLENCYSAGDVSGSSNVGGLIGRLNYAYDIIGNFWDVDTSGQSSGVGNVPQTGITGKTTLEMKTLMTFTSPGWDFTDETVNGTDDIWRMCTDGVNYPRFNWESKGEDFICPDGVNTEDLNFFIQQWLMKNCTLNNNCKRTDLDSSGSVNLIDYSIFAQHWIEGI